MANKGSSPILIDVDDGSVEKVEIILYDKS